MEADTTPLATEDKPQTKPADNAGSTVLAVGTRGVLFDELPRNVFERQFDRLVLPHHPSS
jgi:hypothetical protein